MIKNLDQRILHWSSIKHFNFSLQFAVALFLDENDYLVSSPVRGLSFVGTMAFAISR